MTTARVLHGTLDLLDRQLRDRNGTLCGNVDDLEIERTDDGELFVTNILAGGGALAYRLRRRRLGRWLHQTNLRLHPERDDGTKIAMVLARSIGPVIDVEIDAADLATHDFERWTRTHIIEHIPGGRRARE